MSDKELLEILVDREDDSEEPIDLELLELDFLSDIFGINNW